MRDPDDDSTLDRSYRAAVRLMADADGPAQAQRRRRAVLDAVEAGAQATASGGAPAAAHRPHRHLPAAWWSGALAACVMAGSALVVVRMLDEPAADLPSKVADGTGRRPSPQAVPQAPTAAEPTPKAPEPERRPAGVPKPAGQVAPALAPLAGQAVQPASAAREVDLRRSLDEMAKASSEGRLDAYATPPRQALAVAPAAPARSEAPQPPLAPLPAPMAAPAPVAESDRVAPQHAARAAAAAPRSDLLAAVAAGQVDAARAILNHTGPDSSKDADGRTALALAVLRSDAELVALLLERGADRLAPDRFGQTPLGYAVAAANPAVLKAFGL